MPRIEMPRNELTRTAVRVALSELADGFRAANSDDAETAKAARERLPDLRYAVEFAREIEADPDPVVPAPPELLPDLETVEEALDSDDPVEWLTKHAAELGRIADDAETLRLVLIAAHRNEPAHPDEAEAGRMLTAAERELDRKERAARRMERLAKKDVDPAPREIVDEKGVKHKERLKEISERVADARKIVRVAEATVKDVRADRKTVAVARTGATPVRATEITEKRPERLLSATGQGGSLLTAGNVLVLAGEGGIAKSPLALTVALSMADRYARQQRDDTQTAASSEANGYGLLHGGLFEGAGGAALVLTYEDTAADLAHRLRELAGTWWPKGDAAGDRAAAALQHVHVLAGAGPLFGPTPGRDGDGPAFYNARPGPLDGWRDLWRGAEAIDGLRVLIVDPAMAAYVGQANDPGPVREFYSALSERARALNLGLLLVAHTNKASRSPRGAKDWDAYAPGSVAGSTHWTDAARAALVLDWDEREKGSRVLRVSKANYGPARIRCSVDPVRDKVGEICGFGAAGSGWQTEAEHKEKEEGAADTKPKKSSKSDSGGGKPASDAARAGATKFGR